MCGIVGYTGNKQAAPILLAGLAKLEYRGYDSAGVVVRNGEEAPEVVKAKGLSLIHIYLLDARAFCAPFGVRTLARYEKMYRVAATNNPSCWLGPVWGVSNYMVFRGLKRYGCEELAAELAEKTLAMLAADIRACGEMHEYYDGDTGAPVVNPGFQNWNLLAVNMGAWLRGERAVAEI